MKGMRGAYEGLLLPPSSQPFLRGEPSPPPQLPVTHSRRSLGRPWKVSDVRQPIRLLERSLGGHTQPQQAGHTVHTDPLVRDTRVWPGLVWEQEEQGDGLEVSPPSTPPCTVWGERRCEWGEKG